MAKIKINKLPDGFELVDGKLKKTEVKKDGGYVTGDQADYGLVTTPQEYYGSTNFNNSLDSDVRYSLTGVPREDANVEAEGGETVLADLNSNGQFGLYNINGPRHTGGGVPMFLPEQSFIYSDTNKMKFNKDEMAEFGIETGKRKTPANISKKYQLNPYLAAINDQYADDISTTSAELMLKKNMGNLSKLAFGQELKKNFEEGVPLAAYPYLTEKGIDPIKFTAQVEEITKKQAELNAIASLPPEQQAQVIMLQEMMAQMQDQEQPQEGNPQGNVGPVEQMAMYGTELDKAQEGNNEKTTNYKLNGQNVSREQYIEGRIRGGMHINMQGKVDQKFVEMLTDEEKLLYGKALIDIKDYNPLDFEINKERFQGDLSIRESIEEETTDNGNDVVVNETEDVKVYGKDDNPFPEGHPNYQQFKDAIERGNVVSINSYWDKAKKRTEYKLIEKAPNPLDEIRESEQVTVTTSGTGETPIYTDNDNEVIATLEGYPQVKVRRGIASGGNRPEQQSSAGQMSAGADLSDPKFQEDFELRWGDAIPEEGFDYNTPLYLNEADRAAGRKNPAYTKQWTTVQENMQRLDNEFSEKHGLEPRNLFAGDRGGTNIDGVLGLHTYNIDRRYLANPQPNTIIGTLDDPIDTPDPKDSDEFVPEKPMPWMQDVNNIAAQNRLDNPLILPVLGQAPPVQLDIALDDWTGKVNNINAALNSKLDAMKAFGRGAVAGSDFGKAVALSEDAINKTNTNNINIINQAGRVNADLNMRNNQFNMKQRELQDEGTNLALQRFTDFKNWDTVKSNELWNTMQTNMANTSNLNKTKSPEFQIRPELYGLNTFTDSTNNPNAKTDQRTESEKREEEVLRLWNKADEQGVKDEKNKIDYIQLIMGENSKKNANKDDDNPFEQYNVPSVRTDVNQPTAKKGGMTKLKRTAYPYWMTVGKMGR
tara:strand:+ start:2013 stop:4817 length:2805 start_codon:yes stop_codon:yes gene_type:complete